MRHDELRPHLECTGIRLQFATHERKQGRLASAIGADDSDFFAAIDRERGVGKKQPRTAAQRDRREDEHRMTFKVGPFRILGPGTSANAGTPRSRDPSSCNASDGPDSLFSAYDWQITNREPQSSPCS